MTTAAADSVTGAVLITVDSLRADAVTPSTAPNLTALADEATSFDAAFAHGNWTPFAFPSLLGSAPVFSDSADIGLPGSTSLAEHLSAADITTMGVNAANGFLTSYWGYDRGFDRFESFIGDVNGYGSRYLAAHPTVTGWLQLAANPLKRLANEVTGGPNTPFVDVSNLLDVERRVTQFLESVRGPFFLWLHYMDTHTPYVPAPRHLRAVGGADTGVLSRLRAHVHTGLGRQLDAGSLSALRSLYRGAVHQVDASIGRVFDTLEATGRDESTLVVVTGDHGEEFQEHGHLAHYPKLYDELVHVPLVVSHPGANPRRVSDAVGHDVVPPTIAAAMGRSPDPFTGRSVLPAVLGTDRPASSPVTAVAVRGDHVTQQPIPRRLDDGEVLVSARTDRYTYILHADSGRTERFDREGSTPRSDGNRGEDAVPSDVLASLRGAVYDRLAGLSEAEGDTNVDSPDRPESLDRRLAALGYL